MKKCPICEKTFEDSMRFCQSDGTPLVDDAPPLDPYKTMVARPEDLAAAVPPASFEAIPEPQLEDDEEVLQLPVESDPLKTMYASEEEIRGEMAAKDAADEPVMEIPPLVAPEPPRFSEPSISPPSFGEMAPPPSPFAKATPPIPSPFSDPKPATYEPPAPNYGAYKEPEPIVDEPSFNPFNQPTGQIGQPLAQAEWTPPAAPEASWQNQEIGQNTPFQPPAAGTGGVNQTLPIISLVLGIVSLCCYISPVTGIAALITGYLGMKNIKNDPANYGGKGLAIAGMITGGVFLLLGLLYWVYIIFVVGLAALGSMGGLG